MGIYMENDVKMYSISLFLIFYFTLDISALLLILFPQCNRSL